MAIHSIWEQLGEDDCFSLPGFHAVTGCDLTSSYAGIGKKKAFKILGNTTRGSIPIDILMTCEQFVCNLYTTAKKADWKVNDLGIGYSAKSKNAMLGCRLHWTAFSKIWDEPISRPYLEEVSCTHPRLTTTTEPWLGTWKWHSTTNSHDLRSCTHWFTWAYTMRIQKL